MEKTLVSIGMPVYNNKDTLVLAVKSVFAQTYQNWEMILIDDGSTDKSLEKARKIEDIRVRIIDGQSNQGLPNRLNQIATLARGKYLARMDADDLMHPQRIESQVKYLEENPEVDVVGTDAYAINDRLSPVRLKNYSGLNQELRAVLKAGLLIHASITGHKEWFINNPYDPAYRRSEDHELWSRTCLESRFANLAIPLMFVREAGVFQLSKYLATLQTDRKIIKEYGPQTADWTYTRYLLWRNRLKGLLYTLFSFFHIEDLLIYRRGLPLSRMEFQRATTTIANIARTNVPGWGELDLPAGPDEEARFADAGRSI
ncbi:MAG: glycosyltransferase family A protein [Halanaerobium sp.]|nr:glycosyltransferase family A protein [Halanaerobium sp.]